MSWFNKANKSNEKGQAPQPSESAETPRPASATKGDNPIRDESEDALGRASFAKSFASRILAVDAGSGIVVGVLGPWGSGKTSFVNMARRGFENAAVPVLDFNPWMFSGAEQLVDSFFRELSAQLKIRPGLAEIGEKFEEYGEAFSGLSWLPVVGPWIERGKAATKGINALLQSRKEGVGGRKGKLESALQTLSKPLVVFLDDIDRLSTSEIRDIFKLIRLTASLPNVIYVVAFDRARVEKALQEEGIPGRDYLEKILQVVVDIPEIPQSVLHTQILSGIDAALKTIPNIGPFDEKLWPDVFMEIIRPLLRNMRDVRRYISSARGTVEHLGGQIALVDVLGLEAIRLFLPDVFHELPNVAAELTGTGPLDFGYSDTQAQKAKIAKFLAIEPEQKEVVTSLIERLFPMAQKYTGNMHFGGEWKGIWLKARKVAAKEIFSLYLEHTVGERLLAFTNAEKAWSLMPDSAKFADFLRAIEPGTLQDVIAALEAFEEDITEDRVVPGCVALLNVKNSLPEREEGMFTFGPDLVVTRVVYRLVRALKAPERIEAAVREILPHVETLSAQQDLIQIVGYKENAGHKLVTEAAASDLERAWRDHVRSLSSDALAKESDLFQILREVVQLNGEDEALISVPDTPEVTLAVLTSARSIGRSQAFGSRAVMRSPRLAWKGLVELFGDEETLRQRVASLKASGIPDGEIVKLAEDYLSGWRPDR